MNDKHSGFTLIELIVVITIFMVMIGLSWANITNLPSRSTVQTVIQTLVADIRSQQLQSLTGNTAGSTSQSDYGIYFNDSYYVLFKGSSFSQNDPNNFRVDLNNANVSFTNILFANQILVFAKGSGEVENYSPNADSVSISNKTTGETTIIKINKYGATY